VLLKELNASWESFSLYKKWISRLFHHYNKNTDIHCQKTLHTNFLSIEEFKNKIFFEFRNEVVNSLCKILTEIRNFYFVNVSEEIQRLNSLGGDAANMDIEDNIVNEESQNVEEKIITLKAVLHLFTQILLEKTNERNMVYNQLNEKFLNETKYFFKKNISSKKGFDCKSYLKFAKNLRNLENDFFGRMFEGNESMQFILDNLKRVFYEEVLLQYANELITTDFGYVWLVENKDFEVRKKFLKGNF